jgi:hypothetical protein
LKPAYDLAALVKEMVASDVEILKRQGTFGLFN